MAKNHKMTKEEKLKLKQQGYLFELMCQEFKYSGTQRFVAVNEYKGFKVNAGREAQDGSITSIHTHWMTQYLRAFQWGYFREETMAINLRLGVMPAAMQAGLSDWKKKQLIASTKKLLRLVVAGVEANVKGFKYAYSGCIEFDTLGKHEDAGLHLHAGLIAHGLNSADAIKAAFYEIRKHNKEFKDAYLDFVPFDFHGKTKRQADRDYFTNRGLNIEGKPDFLKLDSDVDYEYAIFVFSYHCKLKSKEQLMLNKHQILTTSIPEDFMKHLAIAKQELIQQTRLKGKRASNETLILKAA